MENQQIHLVMHDGQNEVVFRTGDALPQKPPVKHSFSGTIYCPQIHFNQRKQLIDASAAVVIVDSEKGAITLHENPRDAFADTVAGKLQIHPFMASLYVNTDRSWSVKELLHLLRFKPNFFESSTEYQRVIKMLSTFTVKVENNSAVSNERTGSKSNSFSAVATTSLSDTPTIRLKFPIFVGEEAETFTIEIMVEPDGESVKLYLFSQSLMEREEAQRKQLIADSISTMEESLAIMYVS